MSSPDILATAVVPWTDRFEFDAECFDRQVRHIAQGLTRQIYIFGTAGEGYAVSDVQFDQIAAAFWRCASECAVMPMLGVISLSLPTIIERIARGRAMGFRVFQLSLPSWGPLSDVEVDRFFAETCGRFPDCRFHHYNLARTKRVLTGRDYLRLARAHPNLVAVKVSVDAPDVIADLLQASPRLRFYFTEFGYVLARRTHDVGLLVSLASVNYRRAHAFVNGDDAGREAAARDLLQMGLTLRGLGAGRFHIDGAFDKLLYRVHDPAFPLRLLPPYQGSTEDDSVHFAGSLPPDWRDGAAALH